MKHRKTSKLERLSETGRLMGKARELLAYGGLDGVLQRPLVDPAGRVFPQFAVSANGCRFTDSSGGEVIDWVNGWGPVLLGYRAEQVEKAIVEQLQAGPTLSLMNPVEVEVAQLIKELVPCAEMVAFGKNGSDSVTAALRIARAATGRDMVLQFGFHGFHDWYTCLHPQVKGITPVLREYVDSFEYNNLESLEQLFEKYADRVAAVIMEPVNMWMPDEGYLQAVRDLTHKHGSVLIFDEMVTAFRLARGGAQEAFGVLPDLACLGKGMANGMALSAVVGSRNLMQLLPSCGFGMTFRGETLSLAAAKATLETIRDEPVCEHLSMIGKTLREGFADQCRKLGVKCELSGPDSRMTFVFHDQGDVGWEDARACFLQECLLQGVLTNGNLLPNYAHDQQAVDETLDAFQQSLEKVGRLVDSAEGASVPVGGFEFGIKAQKVMGFIEVVAASADKSSLELTGWLLTQFGAAEKVFIVNEEVDEGFTAAVVQRPDLVEAFPDSKNAGLSGFTVNFPQEPFESDGRLRFEIHATNEGQIIWKCFVDCSVGGHEGGPWSLADGVLYL